MHRCAATGLVLCQQPPIQSNKHSYPSRVCCHWLGAMPAQHVKASERAHEDTSPAKIDVTSKSPVGDISVVTLIRTDTTLDHSQKAEKVCTSVQITTSGLQVASALYATYRAFASGLCQTLRAGSCLHETNTNLVEPVQRTCKPENPA